MDRKEGGSGEDFLFPFDNPLHTEGQSLSLVGSTRRSGRSTDLRDGPTPSLSVLPPRESVGGSHRVVPNP